jgi:hypothetical protein
MTVTPVAGPLRSGLSPNELDPLKVSFRTDVLLAQAETLGRLLRTKDRERKLLWTFTVAYDCFKVHPDSPLAVLNAAGVARIARQFDLAAKLLRVARNLKLDDNDSRSVAIEESRLERARDIDAAGSQDQMREQLIVYACQHCGRIIEYISIPCMFCGWQPLTILDASRSGRLAIPWFSMWDLLKIGREINRGRKATDVVSNLVESSAASMAHPQYRSYVEGALDEAQKKKVDSFFYYLRAASCNRCGASIPGPNPFITKCSHCEAQLRIPPPMKLLKCLARASIHFQHNFAGEQSEGFDLFIRYLASLQSKLFRDQETPTHDQRNRVLESMRSLGKFRVVTNFGTINMSDPERIIFHQNDSVPDGDKPRAATVLNDFGGTLQLLADWMFKTKALC